MSQTNIHTRLLDVLTDVYEFHEQLKAAFADEVLVAAAKIIRDTATKEDLARLDALVERRWFSWESLRFGWPPTDADGQGASGSLMDPRCPELENLVVAKIQEAEDVLRARQRKRGTRREKSQAWLSAVRCVSRKTGRTVQDIDAQLRVLCADELSERGLRGASDGGEDADWIHAVAKKRKSSPLAGELVELDTPENVEELLRLIWDQWPMEAKSIQFPKSSIGSPPSDKVEVPRHEAAVAILLIDPEISPADLAKRIGLKSTGPLYSKSEKWMPVRQTLLARESALCGRRN